MDRLEGALAVAAPPALAEAARAAGCPPDGVRALEGEGRIVRLEDDLAWAAGTYRDLVRRALSMAADGPLTPAAFRDATGTSRRYVLAILEDLDRRGLLRRGDTGHVLGPATLARMRERAEATGRAGPAAGTRATEGRGAISAIVLAGGAAGASGGQAPRPSFRRPALHHACSPWRASRTQSCSCWRPVRRAAAAGVDGGRRHDRPHHAGGLGPLAGLAPARGGHRGWTPAGRDHPHASRRGGRRHALAAADVLRRMEDRLDAAMAWPRYPRPQRRRRRCRWRCDRSGRPVVADPSPRSPQPAVAASKQCPSHGSAGQWRTSIRRETLRDIDTPDDLVR